MYLIRALLLGNPRGGQWEEWNTLIRSGSASLQNSPGHFRRETLWLQRSCVPVRDACGVMAVKGEACKISCSRSGSQFNATFIFHATILIIHSIMFLILKYLLKSGFSVERA